MEITGKEMDWTDAMPLNEVSHRIDRNEEKKIMELVDSLLTDRPELSEEEREILPYRRKKYRAFQEKYATFRSKRSENPLKIYTRKLSWPMLRDLMSVFDLTFKDILEAVCGTESDKPFRLTWATREQERMCRLCDGYLSKSGRERLLTFIIGITSPAFRDTVKLKEAPVRKLFRFKTWNESRRGDSRDMMKELGMEREFLERFSLHSQSVLTFEQIVDLARIFKVSIHWMLCLDQDEVVLAKNGSTELIMDYFCLLPEEIQCCILKGLERHCDIGGTKEC